MTRPHSSTRETLIPTRVSDQGSLAWFKSISTDLKWRVYLYDQSDVSENVLISIEMFYQKKSVRWWEEATGVVSVSGGVGMNVIIIKSGELHITGQCQQFLPTAPISSVSPQTPRDQNNPTHRTSGSRTRRYQELLSSRNLVPCAVIHNGLSSRRRFLL